MDNDPGAKQLKKGVELLNPLTFIVIATVERSTSDIALHFI